MPVAPGTYNYILAPFEWRKLNPSKPSSVMGWTHPVGAATALDLRPYGAMGTPEIAEGYGFFALRQGADIPAKALLLGNDIDGILSTQTKRDAEAMLDLAPGDLDWASVLDNLWGLLTQLADPTGSNAVKPLMPTVQGELDLHLGGHSLVRRERFDKVKHPKALQQIRMNYQRMLKSIRPDVRGEVLQRLMRKTGLQAREIAVPSGGATIADDFTEAGPGLVSLNAHTPTGTNAFTGSWNENVGDWRIDSTNDRVEVQTNGDPNIARADPSSGGLTSDDHYSQSTVSQVFDFWAPGVAARIEAASNDCYIYRRDVSNFDSHALKKYVSGTFSTVGTAIQSDFPDPTPPWEAYLECDGSTITIKEAGVTKITETDPSLSGQTHAGLYAEGAWSNSGIEYASWEAADLSAAQSVALSPAVLSLAAPAMTPTGSGAATVALSPAVLSLEAPAMTPTGSGAVTVAISPSSLSLTAVAVNPTLSGGAQSVNLSPAALSLDAPTMTPSGSGATSIALSPAVLSLEAPSLTPGGSGATTVAISPAALSLVAPALTPEAGTVSVALSPAALSLVAPSMTPSGSGAASVALDPAILSLIAVSMSPAGSGAVSIGLSPAVLSLAAAALTVSVSAGFNPTPISLTGSSVGSISEVGSTQRGAALDVDASIPSDVSGGADTGSADGIAVSGGVATISKSGRV